MRAKGYPIQTALSAIYMQHISINCKKTATVLIPIFGFSSLE
jgi:hypothetical protein